MTSTTVNDEERLALIHETGYWRVEIRPTVFLEERLTSLSSCWDSVEVSQVGLRGWYYPHIERSERVQGDNFVQSGSDFANHVELWRFYQSGQFVHRFAMPEDWKVPSLDHWSRETSAVTTGPRQLDFVDALYTVTEILKFARNLAFRDVLEPAAYLSIELHGTKGRSLSAPSSRMALLRPYKASVDTICWERMLFAAELIATAPQVAIDAAIHIFERFGWDSAPRDLLVQDQRRLLERRL